MIDLRNELDSWNWKTPEFELGISDECMDDVDHAICTFMGILIDYDFDMSWERFSPLFKKPKYTI